MPATTTATATFDMAERLLNCVGAALAATTSGAPARSLVSPGAEIAWDDCECGQLSVHMLRTYPADSFPALKQTGPFVRCEAKLTVAEYVVTILRCVPVSHDDGSPPTAAALTAASRIDHEDRWAVRRGVGCCFANDDPLAATQYLIQEQLAVGSEGQCMGSELHVFVAFPNCLPCTDGG